MHVVIMIVYGFTFWLSAIAYCAITQRPEHFGKATRCSGITFKCRIMSYANGHAESASETISINGLAHKPPPENSTQDVVGVPAAKTAAATAKPAH